MPTISLRSAAYVRAHRSDFPHAYTIQAAPNPLRGELMDGKVPILTPTPREWEAGKVIVRARSDGEPVSPVAVAHYRGSMERRWSDAALGDMLAPGWLAYRVGNGPPRPVEDGAVLTCSCSIAYAKAGECHRAWAAPYLARAGWTVMLDGALFGSSVFP